MFFFILKSQYNVVSIARINIVSHSLGELREEKERKPTILLFHILVELDRKFPRKEFRERHGLKDRQITSLFL